MVKREICKICGNVNAVGFSVPDSVWNQVVPEQWADSVVCLCCFVKLGDEAMVRWDKSIELFPISKATHVWNSTVAAYVAQKGDNA